MVDRLLTGHEVAELLGIKVETLYEWRYKGIGPRGYRIGGNARHGLMRWREAEVQEWINSRADDVLRAAETA